MMNIGVFKIPVQLMKFIHVSLQSEPGVHCACRIIGFMFFEEIINYDNYIWLILRPFFRRESALLLHAG
jgi:hypothetical protein